MENLENLALEVTELARKASKLIGNPNNTEKDNLALQSILNELQAKKEKLRNSKQEYCNIEQ